MKTYNILSIEDFKTNIGNNSRLLGIDPGNKNIGFAICDENKKVATPYKIIQKNKFDTLVNEIDKIIFVVTPNNPFKSKDKSMNFSKRLKTVILACNSIKNSKIKASDIEFSIKEPNYTYKNNIERHNSY